MSRKSEAERMIDNSISTLEQVVNTMSMQRELPKAFAERVRLMHRTLQQSLFRLIWKAIEAWAEDYENERYDLRNEATCQTCSEIIDKVGNKLFPYF